ncbi:SRPBCC domain-containing protein [Parasediminibacterium paludis]|uniref:SRPBCC domain-containing protein n=1 Tax=Parasediminibacterium paludis TaxID=908966 RepID=A0ABV8PZQ1_9BACT
MTTPIVLTVEAIVNAPIDKVWTYWTQAEHIIKWNYAVDDWHCPTAENDLSVGGKLTATMAAKDGSFSFEFWGTYDVIETEKELQMTLGDGRKWKVYFSKVDDATKVVENFEAETTNPVEMQQQGWQMILNNFKTYTETN